MRVSGGYCLLRVKTDPPLSLDQEREKVFLRGHFPVDGVPTCEGVGRQGDPDERICAGQPQGVIVVRLMSELLKANERIGDRLQGRHSLRILPVILSATRLDRCLFHPSVLEGPGQFRPLIASFPIANRFRDEQVEQCVIRG